MPRSYTIDAAIQRYLDHARVERGLSPNTLTAYGTDLARFAQELVRRRGQRVRLKNVNEADILAHVEHLRKAGMSGRSQARHLILARCLFRHLLEQDLIGADPTEIELPRKGNALPSYLSIEEVDRLIAAPDRSVPAGLRDAAMLDLVLPRSCWARTRSRSARPSSISTKAHWATPSRARSARGSISKRRSILRP